MRRWLVILVLCLSVPAGVRVQAGEIFDDIGTPRNDAVARIGPCSGTLIASDVLLTTAHCVPPGWRRAEGPDAACERLPGQFRLAKQPKAAEADWTPVARAMSAAFGPKPQKPRRRMRIVAYAIPHCADMALLRLAARVPASLAIPIPAMTRAPEGIADLLATTRLSYRGFGATAQFPAGKRIRQAGEVGFWAMNRCHIFALPPERAPAGPRILHGDSGSPLLADTPDGLRVVGVLFGSGVPDARLCGWPEPRVPKREGTYTPTFRGKLDDSGATDLGAWIERMVSTAH